MKEQADPLAAFLDQESELALAVGYGSFFDARRATAEDIDLILFFPGARPLHKSRTVFQGVIFDILRCGIESYDKAVAAIIARGRNFFVENVLTSVFVRGDEQLLRTLRTRSQRWLDAGPLAVAMPEIASVRGRLTHVVGKLDRDPPRAAKQQLALELYLPSLNLAFLRRNEWVLAASMYENWPDALKILSSAMADALGSEDIEGFVAIVKDELAQSEKIAPR